MNEHDSLDNTGGASDPVNQNCTSAWLHVAATVIMTLVGTLLIVVILGGIGGSGEAGGSAKTDNPTKKNESSTGDPRRARFVRVQSPEAGGASVLHIAEIEVFNEKGERYHHAEGMAATLFPHYNESDQRFGAHNVINGLRTTHDSAGNVRLAHTLFFDAADQAARDALPPGGQFIQVDLGSDRSIGKIVIYNRTDCCTDRIVGSEVVVRTQDGHTMCRIPIAKDALVYTLTIPPGGGACTLA